jgi:hypothetical protein
MHRSRLARMGFQSFAMSYQTLTRFFALTAGSGIAAPIKQRDS